jgi:hypothetical protein
MFEDPQRGFTGPRIGVTDDGENSVGDLGPAVLGEIVDDVLAQPLVTGFKDFGSLEIPKASQ